MGLDGVGDTKSLLESAMRERHIKWITNARIERVEEGRLHAIEHDDEGKENPLALGLVTVRNTTTGALIGQTQAVVPVSWEMSCSICHTASGESVATNILKAHDRMHGTHLKASQPVLCAGCHSDNALGLPGQPGVSSLSAAMHTAHAERMPLANLENECYACHPGLRTNCQRDVHAANNVTCHDCHGTMQQVGAATRNPWVDEPRCGTCHVRAGSRCLECRPGAPPARRNCGWPGPAPARAETRCPGLTRWR